MTITTTVGVVSLRGLRGFNGAEAKASAFLCFNSSNHRGAGTRPFSREPRDSLPSQRTTHPIVAQNGPVRMVIRESDLDQEARKTREELLKRKRARDLQRQKRAQRKDDALQRFFASDVKGERVSYAENY